MGGLFGVEGGKGYVGLPLKLLGGGDLPHPLPTPMVPPFNRAIRDS